MAIEAENVEENYRSGRAANDADEEMNKDTRDGFANLQAMMPTLMAAPELLELVRTARVIVESAGHMDLSVRMWNAIAKAEGRGE
jgi:hypothetical protein